MMQKDCTLSKSKVCVLSLLNEITTDNRKSDRHHRIKLLFVW